MFMSVAAGFINIFFYNRTLFQFEQFLYTSRGSCSEDNTCYKLWKVIAQFRKTLPKKRDALAVSILKIFLSSNSKYSVPDEISDLMDEFPEEFRSGDHPRPKSSMLLKIQKMAEDYLDPAIKEFLHKEGKVPQDEMAVQPVTKKVEVIKVNSAVVGKASHDTNLGYREVQ